MNGINHITRFFLLFCCLILPLASVSSQELEPNDIDANTEDTRCVEENYRHKADRELERMTPEQLIDESEKEWNYHVGRMDNYGMFTLNSYKEKIGIAIIPVLIKMANDYASRTFSKCQEQRFFTAFAIAADVDNQIVRLRSSKDGQAAISAAADAIGRMKDAGLADQKVHKYNKYPFGIYLLDNVRGTNEYDGQIRKLLETEFKMQMSDEEFFEFIRFLTSTDPAYPSWTPRVNMARDLRPNKEKYRESYLQFKKAVQKP